MSMTPAIEWWRPEPPAVAARPEPAVSPAGSAAGGPIPFGALMVFTFVLLAAPQAIWPALTPLRLAMLSGAAAAAAYLIERMARRQPVIGAATEIRIAIALVAWALVTIPLSWWPAGSLAYMVDPWSKALILFWLLSNVIVTEERLRRTAWCLVLLTVPLGMTALRNFMSGAFTPGSRVPGFGRIAGYEAPLSSNPNDMALTINLILPLAVALLLMTRRPIARIALLAVLALDVAAVVVTFSRGGFLTLLVVVLAFLWRLSGRSRAIYALPLLLIACIPLLPSSYLDHMGTVARIGSDPTGSAQERFGDQVAAVRIALSNPFVGAGVGMNILAMNAERGAAWRMVHNVYLQYALELGLPGLTLFLLLLFRCIRKAGTVRRTAALSAGSTGLFHLAEAVQISLVAFSVAALFHPVGYNLYFYYFAGLSLGLERALEHEGAAPGGVHAA
jgi:probable O-glycosylation ligase (exosortase A-associated)